MHLISHRLSLPAFAIALLMGTASVRAARGIQDEGSFFSESAKAAAMPMIEEVKSRLHKDIVIETFAEAPADVKPLVTVADKASANQAFARWAEKVARAQSVNGVYILLVKQPAHLQVVVGTDTLRQAFTLADRDALIKIMIEKLRGKRNDDALMDGVRFISNTMSRHHGGLVADPASRAQMDDAGNWLPTIGLVLLIWVGFSVVRAIFRSLSGRGGSNSTGGPMGQLASGGFFQNMLGGLFGAAAGMWMYDQFFGGHSAHAAEPYHPASGENNGFTGTDTDYTSSGDSFSDDSGGGFDGGDSGGGDFGGGGDF